jgi:putative transposase
VGYALGERMTSQLAERRAADRDRAAVTDRDADRALRPRRPVPIFALPADPAGARAPGFDGAGVLRGDNAAMESFYSLLQANVLNRQSWAIREQLRIAIVSWIERTYHRRRRQRALGRLTPIEYEAVIGYNRLADAA